MPGVHVYKQVCAGPRRMKQRVKFAAAVIRKLCHNLTERSPEHFSVAKENFELFDCLNVCTGAV